MSDPALKLAAKVCDEVLLANARGLNHPHETGPTFKLALAYLSVRRSTIEECAKVADSYAEPHERNQGIGPATQALIIRDAIRSLAPTEPVQEKK